MNQMIGMLLASVLAAGSANASDAPPKIDPAGLRQVVIEPHSFVLLGSRARQQLIVTGISSGDETYDLTGSVEFVSSNPGVVRIEGSQAVPIANGECQVTVTQGGHTSTATCVVSNFEKPSSVSFQHETQMALTKAGCNMGACHGSPSGKGGFRLSLRAYDNELDIMTLRSEFYGRRINVMEPSQSLLLKKPLMDVAHGGGKRLKKGDVLHGVLEQWIAEGLRLDDPAEPTLVRIETIPERRVLRAPADRQQLVVMGHFTDGSVRDLTSLADFSSSSEAVGRVSPEGLVTKEGRGETAVLARFLDKMATCEVTFLEDVPGFVWNNPAEHNVVDTLVFNKLKTLQILPSDLCSDDEFLRRAYLDVAGRLPTIEEARVYLDDSSPSKRQVLVDQLLDSDDFASCWSLKWCDILRSNSKKIKTAGVHKFQRYVFETIRDDRPLDQFARELLTATGSVFENPAANYWRASRDPLDATETTAQLFLGVRIQCAKCHNHPFERWTQDNYYGIAAAFARVGRKNSIDTEEEVIFTNPAGEVTQPRTGQTMKVHLLLTGDVDVPPEQDRREVFAEWLTQPENPFFAKSIVNRMWGHLMGRGLVEPVDDFRESNPPSNVELLDELARQFVESGFRQKPVLRLILNSRVYQLSSRGNDFNRQDELYNSHAATRLLAAEQLLDSICAVTGVDEKFPGAPAGTRATELPEPPADNYFLKIFGQPQREMACQCERSSESNLSQALQMINGPVVHSKLRDDKGRIAVMLAANKSDEEIVTEIYLGAVSRSPLPEEMAAAKQHIAAQSDRRMGLEDVGWAVLNSKEFLFQH